MKKLLALLCALVMILGVAAGCTGPANGNDPSAGNSGGSTGPDGRTRSAEQTYRMLYNGEVSTLNYLYSASEIDMIFGANCVETLVSSDSYGNLQPAAATSWEVSDDGLTWTLKIREGMKWYDYTGAEKGEVTAEDWVTGAEWVLNAANDSSNSHMMKGYIAGAQEYYDYTSAIVKGETPAEAVSADSIGVKAIDKYTLQYTLTQPRVYFLSLLEFGCYYPVSAACVEENGADLGIDNTRMWYCGAYLMDEFAPQQVHVYVKNPNYWDAENVHIERVERKYNAEADRLTALPLDELLRWADVVSVHAPLNDRTRNLIGARELALMKPSAILINVARGGIVDEAALAAALDAGRLAGAGLDVFTHEPLEAGNPLLSVREPDRLLLSPHNAWSPVEAIEILVECIARNIRDFYTPQNQ